MFIQRKITIINHSFSFYNISLFRTLSQSLLTFNREKDWKEVGNPLVTLFFFNLLYPRTTYWNTSCGEFCMIRHIKDASFTKDFSIGFAISTNLTNNNCVGWCNVHICKQLFDLYNQTTNHYLLSSLIASEMIELPAWHK